MTNEKIKAPSLKHGNLIIYNMDCMEYMRTVPDGYFDLAIVDPPYGIGESGSRNASRGKLAVAKDYKPFAGGDKSVMGNDYFIEVCRVSKNQIVWGANHFAAALPNPSSSCWIVWDKLTGKTDFADCELAYTSFKSAVRKFSFQWKGMLQGDMKNKEVRIHPTQKPIKLYEWLLTNYAKPEFKVVDTHLGSGSHAIAAHYYGIAEFVGCELDPDYYESACQRIITETKQELLF